MKYAVLSLAAVLLVAGFAGWSADLNVNPAALPWNTNAWVDLTVSNLVAGDTVVFQLFVDVDENRSLSAADVPLASFTVSDGQPPFLGAAYLPADLDGATDGMIRTRFSYHGVDSPLHTIGSYVWAVFTNGELAGQQPFAIIQDTSTVWITGFVRSFLPPHQPIPGARVQLSYFSEASGIEPATWTDTNGAFQIYVPSELDTGEVRSVIAFGARYLSAIATPDGEWVSAYPFWEPLSIGENALTNSLYLAPPFTGLLYRIQGRVVAVDDISTNPLPSVSVFLEVLEEGEEADLWSYDITDAAGNFQLVLPGGLSARILVSPNVNQRRYVTEYMEVPTVTQDVTDITIRCFPAQALLRGQVSRAGTGEPVVGLQMFAYTPERMVYGFGYTLSDGVFEIGLLPSNYYLTGVMDEGQAARMRCQTAFDEEFEVEEGEVVTNIAFELDPLFAISGRVFDKTAKPLRGGHVTAFVTYMGEWQSVSDADVNNDASYHVLVPAGTYGLSAQDFSGYLTMNWSNHFLWEWDNGPVYDPVEVSTADVYGINFYLAEAAFIRGRVLADGQPMEEVEVRAFIPREAGWEWRGSTLTDINGEYELGVLGGTSYIVQAQPPLGGFWVHQYYSNAYSFSLATPVFTDVGQPATNIDFALEKGGRIEGQLLDWDGVAPYTGPRAHVSALDISNVWVAGVDADPGDGTFIVTVPPGLYRVHVEAQGSLSQYYGGYFDYQWLEAPYVTVAVEQVTSGLIITMAPPSYIHGEVRGNGLPLSNVLVVVNYVYDTNNWNWLWVSSVRSAGDGEYQLEVPPGSNFAVRVVPEGATGFVEQWWSNAPNVQAATLLTIGRAETVSGIDFYLSSGMRIVGRVTDGDGLPVSEGLVQAWRVETGGWWWAGEMLTDTNGVYALTVSPTTHIVLVRRPWDRPFGEWWYPTTYFSNAYVASQAQVLYTNAGATVSNVNFILQPGYHLTGQVLRAIGSGAITNAVVTLMINDTASFWESSPVGSSGEFAFCLPTGLVFYARADAGGFGSRWFSNVYFSAQAQPIVGSAYSQVCAPFTLAAYNEDVDEDGYDEYAETVILHTDPVNASDYLKWASAGHTVQGVEVHWMSSPGVAYWIEKTTNLTSGSWLLVSGPEWGTGGVMTVVDTNQTGFSVYRIRVVGP